MITASTPSERSYAYLLYFFLPIIVCTILTMNQFSMLDSTLQMFVKEQNGAPVVLGSDAIAGSLDYFDDGDLTADTSNVAAASTSLKASETALDEQESKTDGTSPLSSTSTITSSNKVQSNDSSSQRKYHTGSFANCTNSSIDIDTTKTTSVTSEDAGTITVSCEQISFRAYLSSIHNQQRIITGVLSSASGQGPSRRNIIRETWAKDRQGIFFLVAGPWVDIAEEYAEKKDLIWIDQEEVYNGEQSVLTLKTYSFFAIVHAAMQVHGTKEGFDYTHLFKTDDDSYFNIDALYTELHTSDEGVDIYKGRKGSQGAGKDHDFVGQCQLLHHEVHREAEYKWPLRIETYPEQWFPRYCQGAGFAVSKKFVDRAVGVGHVANIRFMPFEDVAVGMLAERCNIDPQWPSTANIKVFRFQSAEVKKRTSIGDKRTDDLVAPAACMTGKIVQHRIIDDFDMKEHHKSVLDPSYCNITKVEREKIINEKKEQGVAWFG